MYGILLMILRNCSRKIRNKSGENISTETETETFNMSLKLFITEMKTESLAE